jgi:hypothetical protein
MINLKTYPLKDITLSNDVLSINIDKFWSEVFEENKENHLFLLCKIRFSETDQGNRTLGHLVKINYEDKELFKDYISERLTILSDSYVTHPICQISFSYIIKPGKCLDENRTLLQDNINNKELFIHNFNNMNLPITMDPYKYGEVRVSNIINEEDSKIVRYIVVNGNKTYQIDICNEGMVNKVTILGNINLSWIDTRLEHEELEYFKREIKKSTIYFLNGEIILRKKELPSKPFRKLHKDSKLINEFITMDIETITINNKVTPYLINSFDGRHHLNSYNENEELLFKLFMKKLISSLEKGTRAYIYAHNLSSFDGVLLLKHLFSLGKVEPILHNGKIISIKLIVKGETKEDNKILMFKDSYLTLPSSLRKLTSAFNIETSKGYFPFNLTDINYIGVFPKFEYWTNITQQEWAKLKLNHGKKAWSFYEESIKYCELDCKSLHQVLTKYNELIFNEFNINIHNSLTGPSLTMRNFKTNYMPKDTIYQILDKTEFDIRNSYTGGSVDVYIPHNIKGPVLTKNKKGKYKVLYSYDVNSLYPNVMAYKNMPVGKPVVFSGDIRKVEPEAYGFFYCKITSPNNLLHPILQRRVKTSNGMRTVAGLGTWEGWIYSEEMDNAIRFGYQFQIIKGYQFQKGQIFKEYIEKLYQLRQSYPSTHPMNYIAKILMNSLYGKLGMKMETTEVNVFDCSNPVGKDTFNKVFELWAESIKDCITLDNYRILVRNSLIEYKYNEELDMFHGMDVNVAIASAITAGARILMSYFKNNPNFILYYSDTDSVVVDKPLPDSMVGKNLGQLKLEYIIKRAIFLAPKVYGIEDENGKEIIKIKGVTSEATEKINLDILEKLLIENESLEFKQFKWFKKVLKGDITIDEVVYKLKATSNKRAPIYNIEDGFNIYSSTRPYNYNEIN